MFSKQLVIAALVGNISAMSIWQMQAPESYNSGFIATESQQNMKIEALKAVEETEQKKLSAIE